MSNRTIYACGFPKEDKYISIIKDEAIKAVELSKDEAININDNENSVFFLYCTHFETFILDYLNYFSNKNESSPIVMVGENYSQSYLESLFNHHPFTYIELPCEKDKIIDELLKAKEGKCAFIPKPNYKKELLKAKANLIAFHEIATALTAEKDIEKLLNLILTKTRELAKADAGSLYLKEDDNHIRFVFTQNTSCQWSGRKDILLEIKDTSISGYTAKTSQAFNLLDAYSIPKSFPFIYNKTFDLTTGYTNKSMVTMPMFNNNGEVLGVIQLINKRKDFDQRIIGKKLEENQIIPFNKQDIDLLDDLASLAAVALENAKLYQDIQNMFEGFVKASVIAIEAKDPCTHGHSERVADLTVELAKTVNNINEGPFANIKYSEWDLLQIRYASLLHDFGKVSISDEVLTKSKKLFPYELENLISRYKYIRKSIESDHYKECELYINKNGLEKYQQIKPSMDQKLSIRLKEIDDTINLLIKSNEPTVLEESSSERLLELFNSSYKDNEGNEIPYLTEREMNALSVKRGSLTETERQEIESHVKYSYDFLSKIPWAKYLSRVPDIAYSHHEKLNGKGYPNHKTEKEIPLESQMMGITDIFDALTAQDRPYKPALPLSKALNILNMDAKNNALNKDLIELFEKQKVYKCLKEFKDL